MYSKPYNKSVFFILGECSSSIKHFSRFGRLLTQSELSHLFSRQFFYPMNRIWVLNYLWSFNKLF